MFPDLYNPSVPRILIAEGQRINADGIVRPSYLVAFLTVPMLMEWAQLSCTLPAGMAGSDETSIRGQWGGVDLSRGRCVEHHLTAAGQVKIESLNSRLKTIWFDLDDAGDVFIASPKCHVVVGSKAFAAGRGQEIVPRLRLESPEYAAIEQGLKSSDEDGRTFMFGPFLINCGSSISF